MYPYGYRANAGPYPLVVSNHGGPHSADGYAFDFKSQYLAANGYFVLKVNFRSSTGYGEKFLWGTWGGWGNRDGEDVMAGIDYAIARYPIDKSKVATMGHSYGGFMTNWLITQYPDRFAAAIPGAGIVNWVSDYGTADIARTKETGVPRHAVGPQGARDHDPPVAAHLRRQGQGADAVHPRRGRPARAVLRSRADVRGTQEERRPHEDDPVRGDAALHQRLVEPGAPHAQRTALARPVAQEVARGELSSRARSPNEHPAMAGRRVGNGGAAKEPNDPGERPTASRGRVRSMNQKLERTESTT
ncbi:MAG: alpha/beta fold hydrolase [Gemmatimonadetes bacterium]|nr:alpha/beta fold hydrolase [Gemmatimonadota bacterium]